MNRSLLFLAAALVACGGAKQKQSGVIVQENAQPGTPDWPATSAATFKHEVEGYADKTSYAPGDTLNLVLGSGSGTTAATDTTATLDFYRMGWYGGAGAREVLGPIAGVAIEYRATPQPDPIGMIDCGWATSYSVPVPQSWTSGYYLVKLTGGTTGKQTFIPFVVRDDQRRSAILVQSATNTWQAYNKWGGWSLYSHPTGTSNARRVSFNRPYQYGPNVSDLTTGSGDFLHHYQAQVGIPCCDGWEFQLVRWLEKNGYDVSYTTDTDVHENRNLTGHKVLIVAGHGEYWSWAMRDAVDAAIAAGVNVASLSSNTSYWQVRYESADRAITSYKEAALRTDGTGDPVYTDPNTANRYLTTTNFRSAPVNRSEALTFGVVFATNPVDGDLAVSAPSHWMFAGTGVAAGDVLAGMEGSEVDSYVAIPLATEQTKLMHNPGGAAHTTGASLAATGDSGIYRAPSGAYVWATGSYDWSWGLDDYSASARASRVSATVQKVTANFLAHAGAAP